MPKSKIPIFIPTKCNTCLVTSSCTKIYYRKTLCNDAFIEIKNFLDKVDELISIYGLNGYMDERDYVTTELTDDRYYYADDLIKLFNMLDCKKVCQSYSDKQYHDCFDDSDDREGKRILCDKYKNLLDKIKYDHLYENLLNKYIEEYINEREYDLYSSDEMGYYFRK